MGSLISGKPRYLIYGQLVVYKETSILPVSPISTSLMSSNNFSRRFHGFLSRASLCGAFVLGATAMGTHSVSAQPLWGDEFNAATFNSGGAWGVYQPWQFLGRTQFGLSPSVSNENGVSFLRMPHRSWNDGFDPARPAMQSSEIFSKQLFKVGTGIEFEARLRGVNMPRGMVFGIYAYNEKGRWPDGYLKEEIDFEVLTNKAQNQFWSNIWNDWNPRYGYNNGVHNSDSLMTVSNMNYRAWTTYTARWYPDRVEWYVNGTLSRTSRTIVPDDALSVHFNLWAPASDWSIAYDPFLQPTGDPARNYTCFMDIDYVRVRQLPAPTRGVWGNGDGLRATIFPRTDLTGTPVARIDPRVSHDWMTFSPDVNIPNDNFSVRWTGSIASPFTENVTFTLRADDGVRMWIDNKQVINSWQWVSGLDRKVVVPMRAGVKVPIRIEYFEGAGNASAQLSWQSPSMPKTVVPQCQLFAGDATAPMVSISSPVSSYSYRSVNAFGTATDADSGVSNVQATLQRGSDGLFWNGGAWSGTPVLLPATLSGSNWNLSLGFLGDGIYTIAVSARDNAGNSASAPARSFWIDNAAPTTTITTPANNASFASLPSASGTARDIGPGVGSVSLSMHRSSDGMWWTGSSWSPNYAEFKATVSGTNWNYTLPAFSGGPYILWAQSIDYVGNVGPWTRADFNIASAARAASAPVAAPTASTSGSANNF